MEDLMQCLRCDSPAHLSYPMMGGPVHCECSNPDCRLYSPSRFATSATDTGTGYDGDGPRPQWLWITHHHDFG